MTVKITANIVIITTKVIFTGLDGVVPHLMQMMIVTSQAVRRRRRQVTPVTGLFQHHTLLRGKITDILGQMFERHESSSGM
ncbi:hypothetical protein [Streptomyces sp. NPDC048277]|uniref:hypothetical protein n=1 Tax=Streptomyces sp. NPDC048277 TaxID=3155027 RepID=UPI0033CBE3CA